MTRKVPKTDWTMVKMQEVRAYVSLLPHIFPLCAHTPNKRADA